MPQDEARITVVGAGAIGGVTAARLSRAGHSVTLVTKHREVADQVKADGLEIRGLGGEFRAKMDAVAGVDELAPGQKTVLLTPKAHDALEAARGLLPLLAENAMLVSLQNGIVEPSLAEIVGARRVVGCVVGWGASMLAPGTLEVTSSGEFVVGELDGALSPRVKDLAPVLSAVAPARVSQNIMGELYSKLIVNSCINSLGALSGLRLGALLAKSRARELFIAIMSEAMAVAKARGLKVEPGGGGKLDYYEFLESKGWLAAFKRHLMIRLIGFKYRRIKSSTLQSIERGRASEIDFLNGYIVRAGEEAGVETPVNRSICSLVKEIEAKQRPISPDNLFAPELPV